MPSRRMYALYSVVLVLAFLPAIVLAQTTNARLTGFVSDATKAVLENVQVDAINQDTGVKYTSRTNDVGSYTISNLPPGSYKLEVVKAGFKTVIKPDIVLHVQDAIAINFTMAVGSTSESITVEGGAPLVNTESSAVSTVIDHNLVENMPLNGRSFQTLIQLSPGVTPTASNSTNQGQFSINGQRADGNYFTVDGVSANFSAVNNGSLAQVGSGSLPGFTALGTTANLVSVDAMQEFRIQTSSFAPEFGRQPGGQISILTRSGNNEFHASAFEYFRNDVLDSNDWFSSRAGLKKSEERNNDFGGTVGGPILKDKTFFFFSYEGLRLRLPQTANIVVPSLGVRQTAIPAAQPILNAFPLPTAPEFVDSNGNPTGAAPWVGGFSNPGTVDAYSIRVDHKLKDGMSVFGRYAYSPSLVSRRGINGGPNLLTESEIDTRTLTLGYSWLIRPSLTNEVHFNYSNQQDRSANRMDNFGGAIVPADSAIYPPGYSSKNATFSYFDGADGIPLTIGPSVTSKQRQLNIIDNVALLMGRHTLKFGVDFRRLSPQWGIVPYEVDLGFNDFPSTAAGNLAYFDTKSARSGTEYEKNLGAFAQDAWKLSPRLTLTYGFRWELEPAPSLGNDLSLLAVNQIRDFATMSLVPLGAPLWKTTYANFAPRIGAAYVIRNAANRETVIRAGGGVFYDLASKEAGQAIAYTFPFFAFNFPSCPCSFPLTPSEYQAPQLPSIPLSLPSAPVLGFFASDPKLKLPYTIEWNVSLEQALSRNSSISATYVGALGRRLLQTETLVNVNANLQFASIFLNGALSNYNALQLQFKQRLTKGLQAMASYTLAHSLDDSSTGSYANSDVLVNTLTSNANYGNSSFDIRNAVSGAVLYNIPGVSHGALRAISENWGVDNILLVRSASPIDLSANLLFPNSFYGNVRPDIVPGVPVNLHDPSAPGGVRLNPAAFTDPPVDPNTGFPSRQGTLGRNQLRLFGTTQWDFAVRREFAIAEHAKFQFRAEFFNLLNHPNFGAVATISGDPRFGRATQMLNNSLTDSGSAGGLSPLYQIGGPRSIQLSLRLTF